MVNKNENYETSRNDLFLEESFVIHFLISRPVINEGCSKLDF